MIVTTNQIPTLTICFIFTLQLAQSATVKDIFIPKINSDNSEYALAPAVRVPRETADLGQKQINLDITENLQVPAENSEKVIRKARDSKYFSDNYGSSSKNLGRSLKPEDNLEDSRDAKGSTSLGKRCTTCDSGYLGSYYSRSRDRYDRDPYATRYDRDPYSSTRDRYDRYDRYDGDRYYDDYDRDGYRDYRGRTRYSPSTYDRYDTRDRYYDRGIGYDNRGYDPYDDYYSRGYDSSSRGGGYYSKRPDYYGSGSSGGYARGYSYGDRDRYGGYGSGSGSYGGYGNGYGNSGYGSYGGGYGSSGYGGSYSGSRSRYPSYDYLYGRPSSTTTDIPKNSDGDGNTVSPSQTSSSGRTN